MVEAPAPSLRLRIDTDALIHNWQALDEMSAGASAGAAIKANCYGLGIEACLPALLKAGAEEFFVAHWSEVEAASRHVNTGDISVLHGPMNAQDAAFALETGAVPVINSIEQARRWIEAGGGRCHLMINTGINRLGIQPAEVGDDAIAGLDLDIVMSHLASADDNVAQNGDQLDAFITAAQLLDYNSLSLANSAGIALGNDFAFDLTRPGLSLYGGIARPELNDVIRQVAYPEAAILQKRSIKAGESVGYNAEFTAPHDMTIGVVSLGYADGFLRTWNSEGTGFLLHGAEQLPLLGKVSMDMIVVDLTNAPELREGDWLSVPYSLQDAAQQTSLSQYELLTILGNRFAR